MDDEQTPKKKLASREDFLQPRLKARRFAEREFDGLGLVRIRSLNDKEHTKLQAALYKRDGSIDTTKTQRAVAALICACVVDAEGNTILTDADVDALRSQDAALIAELGAWIREHVGGLEKEDADPKNESPTQ